MYPQYRPEDDDDDGSPIITTTTASTNATIDNQPGAGRMLDNAYQSLGRTLDRGIAKLMNVLSKKANIPPASVEDDHDAHADEISIISFEPVDNQIGPGRTLDNFFFKPLGRKLEKSLGDTADRLGFGPNAIERKLLRLLGSVWLHSQGVTLGKKKDEMLGSASGVTMNMVAYPGVKPVGAWQALDSTPESKDKVKFEKNSGIFLAIDVHDESQADTLRKISKTCKRLLKHVRPPTFSTRLRALDHLINLIFVVPELRRIFLDRDALKALEDLVNSLDQEIEQHVDYNEYRTLLTWSRRALLSVQDSDVSNAAKDFICACEATQRVENGWRSSSEIPWLELGSNFIEKARAVAVGQKVSFLDHPLCSSGVAQDFLENVTVPAVIFSDDDDLNTLSAHFISAFTRMQEKGIYFTPKSLEPLELALLLSRMSTGASFWPCIVGPVSYDVLDELKGVRLRGFYRVLDTGRFHPLLAKACHLISEHSFIYFVRDARDESLIYGTIDDLPEALRGQMRKRNSDFLQNMYTMVQYMSKDNPNCRPGSEEPERPAYQFRDTVDEGMREFGKQFGWQQLVRWDDFEPDSDGDENSSPEWDNFRPEEMESQSREAGPSRYRA